MFFYNFNSEDLKRHFIYLIKTKRQVRNFADILPDCNDFLTSRSEQYTVY